MRVTDLELPGLKLIEPVIHRDPRGYFAESFRQSVISAAGGPPAFIQDNHALSIPRFTVRGMHFQVPPHAQTKLVRVVRGAILDVVLDLRAGGPGFGRAAAVELSAANFRQLLVPAGFAHGYCTLEPDTEVLYKVDSGYARDAERGLHWRDPALALLWPVAEGEATLSDRDRTLPMLAALPEFFRWSGA